MKLISRKKTIAASAGALLLAGAVAMGVAGIIPTDKDNENTVANNNEETVIEETMSLEPIDRNLVMGSVKEVLGESEEDSSEETASKQQEEETAGEQKEQESEASEQPKSEWDNQFMVNINEYLNVRESAGEEAEVIGKLYEGAGGTVIEKGDQWTKISSGNVEGYVATDYLLFGKDAENKAIETGARKAVITEDNIRVRKAAGTDATVLGLAEVNDVYTVSNISDGWIEIQYDGEMGYVSQDYAKIEFRMGNAITIEEEQERLREEEERKHQEELERQQREAEEKEEQARIENESKTVETVVGSSYDANTDDAYLLACLVHAEAGSEPYEGKLAVANVVLNRVNRGFGDSISSVIYARGQFSVVTNGRLASVIANGPNSESVQAANEALSGVNNVPDYLFFCMNYVANYSRYNNYSIIGTQVFYN